MTIHTQKRKKPPAPVSVHGQQNMLCVACFQPATVSSHPTTGRPRHSNQRTSPETLWASSATLACHSHQSECERYEYVYPNRVPCTGDLQSRSDEQAARPPCGPQPNPHPTATPCRATARSPSSPNAEWASRISDKNRKGWEPRLRGCAAEVHIFGRAAHEQPCDMYQLQWCRWTGCWLAIHSDAALSIPF